MSDDYGKLGPISESAIRNVDKIAKEQGHHAAVLVSEDKTLDAEVGTAIKDVSIAARFQKKWKGPWSLGTIFRW